MSGNYVAIVGMRWDSVFLLDNGEKVDRFSKEGLLGREQPKLGPTTKMLQVL